jgi:hypothetical protein
VHLELGEVDGVPALLTDINPQERLIREKLWLYTAEQTFENEFMPRVRFKMQELSFPDITMVDGRIALVGEEYADNMKGWALVRVTHDRCSPQTIVTRCTYYQQYTTEEALQAAAESYGGLTERPFLSPR